MPRIRILPVLLTVCLLLPALAGCMAPAAPDGTETRTSPEETGTLPETGSESAQEVPDMPDSCRMTWPEDRIFPLFGEPEGELDALSVIGLGEDERITVSCLQGLVNAKAKRLVILDDDVEAWLKVCGYGFRRAASSGARYRLLAKYAKEISGVVLYDTALSRDYANLACSAASVCSAIPMTRAVYEDWKDKGIELPVLEDLTGLEYTEPADIYRYLLENYWFDHDHRILLVQRPGMYQMRDLAAAVGGAVVYLSCAGGEETELFRDFLRDLTPGKSILTGWYADQERELMTVIAQHGLSCVPSDHFSNPTVFSRDEEIRVREEPEPPQLENRIYVAFYFSDGDNIQYDMHAMREYWKANGDDLSLVPVTWTVSPALADLAPGMLNEYYDTAPDNVCFACGPSGMGYTMPVNTFGANIGENFTDEEAFRAYVSLTDRYLERTGLRVVTVWDNLSPMQRLIYTESAPYLYGLTVQHFTDSSLSRGYTETVNGRLIQQLTPGYFASNAEGTTPLSEISDHIRRAVRDLGYDGTFPVFVSVQVSVWAFHSMRDVAALRDSLNRDYAQYGPGAVEFVRADHYFRLYNEASGRN